jgi:hypothetical protein
MPSVQKNIDPFLIKDCALIAVATGKKAQNLRELRDYSRDISLDSIYYHFWGGLLRPKFDDPEYHNDFALWARHSLHDKILAERLAVIDPNEFKSLEELRQELVEILDERIYEEEYPLWAKSDDQFEFIRSQIVIFNTHHTVSDPKDFVDALPKMSLGSIFFHFIDALRRNPDSIDDLRVWLGRQGKKYQEVISELAAVDPYFLTLNQLRTKVANILKAKLTG